MKFDIKKLTLYKNLRYSLTAKNSDKNESLKIYTNAVMKNNMDPNKNDYLKEPRDCGFAVPLESGGQPDETVLPAGQYLFVQGNAATDDIKTAAEELWLESLWLETELEPKEVFVRNVTEDGRTVFQIFRRIL
ncbi:MAG: hypothetical protein J6Y75_05820 [Spirochaetaceae bacterium]|nr:hypothetical protein [Spirochaetaceae bacterium]MBP5329401.1 hypothetical protein [Spirochaetaceae bacterium]